MERLCPVCGVKFQAKRDTATYHSTACRVKAKRMRDRQKRIEDWVYGRSEDLDVSRKATVKIKVEDLEMMVAEEYIKEGVKSGRDMSRMMVRIGIPIVMEIVYKRYCDYLEVVPTRSGFIRFVGGQMEFEGLLT